MDGGSWPGTTCFGRKKTDQPNSNGVRPRSGSEMSTRPSSKLIDSCVQQLLLAGKIVDSEQVADYLKETQPPFRRFKRNVLVRLVEPMVRKALKATAPSSGCMNASLHNMYRAQRACRAPEASSSDDTLSSESETNETGKTVSGTKRREMPVADTNVSQKRLRRRRATCDQNMSQMFNINRAKKDISPETVLPDFSLDSLGGVDKIVTEVRALVIRPLIHPEVYEHLGVLPARGILLHGPPGSGKTKLALAVAGEAKVPFFKISGPELITGLSGESEQHIRDLFAAAKLVAPSFIFIDEIDTLCPKRENAGREMERRIVAQLGTCMDDLEGSFVIVMGATNRADALDPMIRRNGRFDREIAMGIPDDDARVHILKSVSAGIRFDSSVNYEALGKLTPGFVGADLEAVVKEAALVCVDRMFSQFPQNVESPFPEEALTPFAVSHADFVEAVARVQPSAKREGFATCPDVSWEDVGGLMYQRKELEDQICHPIRERRLYEQLGITVPAGILLFGPPGCGKTLLAKAVARESGANFIAVKGPELLNKYVGESERAIRQVFQRARMSAPCIIFFDELDSLCCRRGRDGHPASERVVNQLLTEMDGVEDRKYVFVVAATNRPELIDPAMLRPGRLDRLVAVPLPDVEKRVDILRRLGRRTPLDPDVDLHQIAGLLEGFSGADLAAVLRQAVLFLLEEYRQERPLSFEVDVAMEDAPNKLDDSQCTPPLRVHLRHLMKALDTVKPSVTAEHRLHYEQVYAKMITGGDRK